MNEFVENNYKLVIYVLGGLLLIVFGVGYFKFMDLVSPTKIEVLNATTMPNSTSEVTVEIAGSVEKVGVYKLPNNSRVEDLLTVSGGLSLTADRVWVSQNLNRASLLKDGQKIYIYSQSEVKSAKNNNDIKLSQSVLGESIKDLLNINTASPSDLDKLSGIGPFYAQKIIDQRPYSKIEELVEKQILPKNVYEKIKNSISAN